jgi:hypothetical protein
MRITLTETATRFEAKHGLRFDDFVTSMNKDQRSLSGLSVTRVQFESVVRCAARKLGFRGTLTLIWAE